MFDDNIIDFEAAMRRRREQNDGGDDDDNSVYAGAALRFIEQAMRDLRYNNRTIDTIATSLCQVDRMLYRVLRHMGVDSVSRTSQAFAGRAGISLLGA